MPIPKLIITAALMAANMAMTMTKKIEGPRLDDMKFTGGDYGVPLPMVWGMRRMQVPIFWAENLREVKRRRKTKGGKFNDYSYFGTWAVALAGHEIAAVRRIWFDTHLVYDLSGAGPVTPFDFGGAGTVSDYVTIYLGTDDQEPDPRMQATVEAEFGEGSCPAYCDTAYIVFKDIPLEKIGNRIPQVSVEILGATGDVFPIDYAPSEVHGLTGWRMFSPDYALLTVPNTVSGDFSVFDVAARQQITSGSGFTGVVPMIRSGGTVLRKSGDTLAEYDLGGTFIQTFHDFSPASPGAFVGMVYDGNGTEHRLMGPGSGDGDFWLDEVQHSLNDLIGETGSIYGIFTDLDGNVWGVGKKATSATEAFFYRFVEIESALPQWFKVTGLPSSTGTGNIGPACHFRNADIDHFVFQWEDDLYAVDPVTASVTFSQTAIEQATVLDASLLNLPIGASTIWVGHEEFSLADLTKIREVNMADWDSEYNATSGGLYDPVNHALVAGNTGEDAQAWLYLDRIDAGPVTLETICNDVAEMCGVEDYDFSDLDQLVTGWSATRGPANNMLEPLLDIHDSDFRPHDFTIEGLKRTGTASGGTLATEWFAGDPRYTVKVRQASELPRAVLIDFADVDADQQPNSVRSDRPLDATDARSEQKIDLTTYATDPDEARQFGNRHFRRLWNERKEIALALTAQELKLEPGDVRTLELDGEELDARCVRLTIQADDVLSTEWRYDHPSLATLDGSIGATFDGRDEQSIPVPLLSRGFVLDIPLLTDVDEETNPVAYPFAAPFASGTWPGAIVYQETGGEFTDEFASVPSSDPVTWGSVAEAMPYTNPNLWDRSTVLTVTLQVGELTGCTEAAADANRLLNLAVIGAPGRWEIVQFTTATLIDPMTYEVSGFKRGRRGTEWACELHEAGDIFLLVEGANPEALGLSDVGDNLNFKAITAGRTEAGAPEIPVEPFTGASKKPYAPCQFEAVKEANGDWTITWVRRTRIGGAWVGGSTIPLGEDTEEYDLVLSDGVTDVTKTVTSPTYTWDVATQTSDTGAEVMAGDLEATVYQISAQVDRGFAAELTA